MIMDIDLLGKGSKKIKKRLIEFSIKGWVGVSGGGQILFKIHFRPTFLYGTSPS